ncbi:tripartite tricarboxylate transporter substrate binding protein [Cupriavidus metallidurans]|uniref:tripartite tricarboxylate transporter substrate binding protein n=1 Tax=Cupriavidus metallidurans TaxID=119219 RepID=UPI001CCEEEBE|nr:tripartite tricarboxylate transporter substrate binding protein [Cupriavidus metallidurans]UBM07758.1 tripartite tricarboxylate transporter substrate binding protein [Cupriavidus metallidurans]
MNIRNRVAGLLACLGVLSVSGTGAANAADAPAFPTKPVSIVVPYAAGGATDIIARLIGKRLGEVWKQPVVVVNKPGAGTVLGAGFVAKSPGDGYTLYMTTAAHTISGSLYRSLPYDPVKDFAPINLSAIVPLVLVVGPTVPAKDLPELLAYARSHPGATYASPGNGSPQHLAGALFKSKAGLELTHVPYKGDAPMLSDLMGGQVQMAFVTLSSALPHIKSGKLRAIALAHSKRSPTLPNVPTFTQAGLPFQAATWFGLFSPATMPPGLRQKINEDVTRIVAEPATRASIEDLGGDAVNEGPKAFSAFIDSESKRWAEAVKVSGAQVD